MSIVLKRGKTVVKDLSQYDIRNMDRNTEVNDEYSNVLNVRINRPTTIAVIATVKPLNNITNNTINANIKREELNSTIPKFDVDSTFIPRQSKVENRIVNPLSAYGLTEEDFEEPKNNEPTDPKTSEDENITQDDPNPVKEETEKEEPKLSIEEKYAEYADDDFENFEKIPKKRNIDNY